MKKGMVLCLDVGKGTHDMSRIHYKASMGSHS